MQANRKRVVNKSFQIVQPGVQQGAQLIMTSSGLKQVVQAQAAPQRSIQPHPPVVQSPTPRGAVSVARQSPATPPATATSPSAATVAASESLMPNEELNGIDSEHIGDASIEEAPVHEQEETVVTQDGNAVDEDVPPEAVQEEVVQENVSEPSEPSN